MSLNCDLVTLKVTLKVDPITLKVLYVWPGILQGNFQVWLDDLERWPSNLKGTFYVTWSFKGNLQLWPGYLEDTLTNCDLVTLKVTLKGGPVILKVP